MAPTALAAPLDFEPQSAAWNGMSYLLETAAEAHVDVELRRELDFSTLDPRVILMLVAPRVGPGDHLPSLRRYLDAGGRLVVADDFRAGYRWLRPFGIELHNRAGPAVDHVADLRFLPRFDLAELGPYLDFYDRRAGRRPQIVLNHPASLVISDDAPAGSHGRIRGWFSDRARGWLAEVRGKHRILALADSSVFINAMLRGFYGNKQLAANILRYFCYVDEPCKVRVISNLTTVLGSFDADRWGGSAHGRRPQDLAGKLRHMATQLSDLLRKKELALLWWALILIGLATPVVMRARTAPPVLPPRTAADRPRTRLHDTVAAWLAVPDADYRQPARLLAGHLAGLVQIAGSAPGTAHGGQPEELHELPAAIERLVADGMLSAQAAERVGDIVLALREVAGAGPTEVDRQRFTALAAEVEWAEEVLGHTALGLRAAPRQQTINTKGAA